MRARRRRGRSAAGFTLIEVMIASVILLIGIAAVVMGLRSAHGVSAHQRYVTQALHATESVMEDLLFRNAGHADLSAGNHGPRWFNEVGIETPNTSVFRVDWNVVGETPFGGMKRITVTTTWQEGDRARKISITTDRP